MFEILFPLPFLLLGIGATFFREKTAELFCRMGRAMWKRGTFGLTDMAALYREEQAKKVFLLIGPIFLCAGLALTWISVQSFRGPNTWAAMRQARSHLAAHHPASGGGWSFTARAGADERVEITYRYGEKRGRLLAIWQGDHYEFTELPSDGR